jgi:hypothetical protein
MGKKQADRLLLFQPGVLTKKSAIDLSRSCLSCLAKMKKDFIKT